MTSSVASDNVDWTDREANAVRKVKWLIAFSALLLLTGCFEGSQGPAGQTGQAGPKGESLVRRGRPARKVRLARRAKLASPVCGGPSARRARLERKARPEHRDRLEFQAPKATRVSRGRPASQDLRASPDRRRAICVWSRKPAVRFPAIRAKCSHRCSAATVRPRPSARSAAPSAPRRMVWLGSASSHNG